VKADLSKSFFAEVAHHVPRSGGVGARLHGHTLKIDIVVAGEVQPEFGWVVDFGEISRRFQPLYDVLDHSYVNEVGGMADPSLDGIRDWLHERLAPGLPWLKDVRVSVVGDNCYRLVELPASEDLPARLAFTFEAAQSLPHLPEGHKCRRLHGHSYRVEVGAADLDRLRPLLETCYEALDHRSLNDIAGLEEATCERICEYLWNRLEPAAGDLEVVVVGETPTTRCEYYGE